MLMDDSGNARERYALKKSRYGSHEQVPRIIGPNQRVLDVGCADGFIADKLVQQGCAVVGIDRVVGELAKTVCESTHIVDLENGLADLSPVDPFDVVLLADCLSHVKKNHQLIQDCKDRLLAGGRLVASVGNIAHLSVRLPLLLGRFEYAPRGILEEGHVALYTVKSLQKLLQAHGLEIVDIEVSGAPFERVLPPKWFLASEVLSGVSYYLAKLWRSGLAYQFIVTAQP